MFPDWAHMATFEDIVALSTRRLKRDAFARAAAAAADAAIPFDVSALQPDVDAVAAGGLLTLVRHRQRAITECVQPGIAPRVPPPTPTSASSLSVMNRS